MNNDDYNDAYARWAASEKARRERMAGLQAPRVQTIETKASPALWVGGAVRARLEFIRYTHPYATATRGDLFPPLPSTPPLNINREDQA